MINENDILHVKRQRQSKNYYNQLNNSDDNYSDDNLNEDNLYKTKVNYPTKKQKIQKEAQQISAIEDKIEELKQNERKSQKSSAKRSQNLSQKTENFEQNIFSQNDSIQNQLLFPRQRSQKLCTSFQNFLQIQQSNEQDLPLFEIQIPNIPNISNKTKNSINTSEEYHKKLVNLESNQIPEHILLNLVEKELQNKIEINNCLYPDFSTQHYGKQVKQKINGQNIQKSPIKNVSPQPPQILNPIKQFFFQLPIEINPSLTIICTGEINWKNEKFHSKTNLLPVGFKSIRIFNSLKNKDQKCQYTCEIQEKNSNPFYVVHSDEKPDQPFTGLSASNVWLQICFKKKNNLNGIQTISGTERYGLTNQETRQILEKLPNAEKCKKYIFKFKK